MRICYGAYSAIVPAAPSRCSAISEAAEGPGVLGGKLADQLSDFLKSGAPNSALELPPSLSDWQKRSLHKWASKSGLKSMSIGEGAARHLTMTQPAVPLRFTDPISKQLMEDRRISAENMHLH